MGAGIPAGYRRQQVGDCELVAADAVVAALGAVLSQHGTLYAWAAEQPQPRAMRGRAPVFVASVPMVGIDVVVRHVWHGGFLAPITGDLFRLPTRAPIELANALQLRAAGVPTTDILGYALYPAGAGFRRVDVVSRLIPEASDFGAVLAELAPGFSTAESIAAVRELLARLAAARAVHPDLNVKNILLSRQRRRVEALVIDVDVVRFEATLSAAEVMERNIDRLLRSMRKWRTHFGADISDHMMSELRASCMHEPAPPA